MSEQSEDTPKPPARMKSPVAIVLVAVYLFIEWKFSLLQSTSTIGELFGMAVCLFMFVCPLGVVLVRAVKYDEYYEALTKRQWMYYREKKCPCCEKPITSEAEDDTVRRGWGEIASGYTGF